MPRKLRIATVVTDLDNTLFDWVEMWGASFTALLDVLQPQSGISRDVLLAEIKAVHQRYHTSEYAFLVQSLPSLQQKHPGEDLTLMYAVAPAVSVPCRFRHASFDASIQGHLRPPVRGPDL